MGWSALTGIPGGGAGATPGGADTNIQYNDGGVFGGSNNFVFDSTATRVGIGLVAPTSILHLYSANNFAATGLQIHGQAPTAGNTFLELAAGNLLDHIGRLNITESSGLYIDSSHSPAIVTVAGRNVLYVSGAPDRLTVLKQDGGALQPAPVGDSNCVVELNSNGNATNLWYSVPSSGSNATFGWVLDGGTNFKHGITYVIPEDKVVITSFGSWPSPSDGLFVDNANNVSVGAIAGVFSYKFNVLGNSFFRHPTSWVAGDSVQLVLGNDESSFLRRDCEGPLSLMGGDSVSIIAAGLSPAGTRGISFLTSLAPAFPSVRGKVDEYGTWAFGDCSSPARITHLTNILSSTGLGVAAGLNISSNDGTGWVANAELKLNCSGTGIPMIDFYNGAGWRGRIYGDSAVLAVHTASYAFIMDALGASTQDLRFTVPLSGGLYAGFKAPSGIVANQIWALPNTAGAANQMLVTDGSNNLGWATQKVFGDNYQSAAVEARTTTTSATYQDKTTLTTGALTGTYRVGFVAVTDSGAANNLHWCRLYNSTDATTLVEFSHRPSQNTVDAPNSGFQYVTFTGAAKTFIVQYRSATAGDTTGIANARIELWRVS